MRISIIGSNSMLASYIINDLIKAEGIELYLFGKNIEHLGNLDLNSRFIYFNFPTKDIDLSLLSNSDLIIYCAATGVQSNQTVDNSITYEINAILPIRIINYLEKISFKGKWISFGSYFEIGNNESLQPYTEEEVISSVKEISNHYCSSKRVFTRFISSGFVNISFWHFILPTIYGSHEHPHRLIPYIINALKKELPLKLSKGEQIRQYLHCNDIVNLIKIIKDTNLKSGVYNVAGNDFIKIAGLVNTIFSLFDKDASSYLGTLNTRDENMKTLILNSKKIQEDIPNWKAEISLKQGIIGYL